MQPTIHILYTIKDDTQVMKQRARSYSLIINEIAVVTGTEEI
jgi:hypothetical protein